MKTLKTLVVDDDLDHTRILREAAAALPRALRIDSISNGEEALRYLAGCDSGPDLILLDLHLPGCDGFEFLTRLRASPKLSTIPVMVLSDSADAASVTRAYLCGANLFFTKPLAYDRYRDLVDIISRLWTGFAELPARCTPS